MIRTVAIVNTGSGRNLGDRAMLVALLGWMRSQGLAAAYVPVDLPQEYQTELRARGYPLFYHCLGRFDTARRGRLGQIVATLTSVALCFSLALLRRTLRKELPWTFMEAQLVNALGDSDAVVFSGGGYLTDVGKLECRACLITGLLGWALGKRIYMTGQGIGPFDSALSRLLMRAVASKAKFVAVRDQTESIRCLESLGLPSGRAIALGDDALALGTAINSSSFVPRMLGVHYRSSALMGGSDQVRRELSSLIAHYRAEGWQIRHFLFSTRNEEERSALHLIDPALSPESDVVSESDPRRLCAAVAQCSVALGMAYHFSVFCLSSGVPVLSLYGNDYYRQKNVGLLEWFGRGAWGVAMQELSAGVARRMLDDMASVRELHAEFLKRRAIELVRSQRLAYGSAMFAQSEPMCAFER